MSLTTTTPKETKNTDGETLAFDFSFKMWSATIGTELAVIFNTGETDEEDLILGTDYTLSAPNNNYKDGGTVTLVTGSAYAADGNTITIKSTLARSQTYDLQHGGVLNPDSLETALDRMVRIVQELELEDGIEQTALSNYMKTLLTKTTAAAARDTLDIYSPVLVYEGEVLTHESEILTWVA